MLDYRLHYAQMVAEDRLRTHRTTTEAKRLVTRIHRPEPQRPVTATARR